MKPTIDSAIEFGEAVDHAYKNSLELYVDREALTRQLRAQYRFGGDFPHRPTTKQIRFMVDLHLGAESDEDTDFDHDSAAHDAQELINALRAIIGANFEPGDVQRLSPYLRARFIRLFTALGEQVRLRLLAFIDADEDERLERHRGEQEMEGNSVRSEQRPLQITDPGSDGQL